MQNTGGTRGQRNSIIRYDEKRISRVQAISMKAYCRSRSPGLEDNGGSRDYGDLGGTR